MRLAEKTPLPDAQGRTTRLRRRWDTAQTPFQRLIATGTLDATQHEQLQRLYDQTNPLALRQRIYQQLAALRDATAERTAPSAPLPSPAA
ncbi:MAG: hypothetical protein IVW57_08740 [Ktedonobacterales bacterium]|nr:hypothetical protein [Ktedonobacterales bacterium]